MEKHEALGSAVAQIERQFGKGAIMRMGDAPIAEMDAIPTGSLALDIGLGIGGIPKGRIVEIYGPESSGKTTMVYHLIAEAQKRGGLCAFIDAEHSMDPAYAKNIGVNVDELLLSQPDHGEQALEIADLLVRSAALDVVAIDSVAALVPKAEIEGEMGDTHVGLQARLMSQALRKLAGNLHRAGTICIFTNQLREKIGVMFGSPETTPGGRALKFYASVRLDIRRIETLKEGTEAVGNRARVKIVKNKVAPPFRQAEFDIIYGEGISHEGNLIDLGVERGMVQKSGAYFSFGDERLGQGRNAARAFLKEHREIADQLEAQIRDDAGVPSYPSFDPTTGEVIEPPSTTKKAAAAAAKVEARQPHQRRRPPSPLWWRAPRRTDELSRQERTVRSRSGGRMTLSTPASVFPGKLAGDSAGTSCDQHGEAVILEEAVGVGETRVAHPGQLVLDARAAVHAHALERAVPSLGAGAEIGGAPPVPVGVVVVEERRRSGDLLGVDEHPSGREHASDASEEVRLAAVVEVVDGEGADHRVPGAGRQLVGAGRRSRRSPRRRAGRAPRRASRGRRRSG